MSLARNQQPCSICGAYPSAEILDGKPACTHCICEVCDAREAAGVSTRDLPDVQVKWDYSAHGECHFKFGYDWNDIRVHYDREKPDTFNTIMGPGFRSFPPPHLVKKVRLKLQEIGHASVDRFVPARLGEGGGIERRES